MEQQNCEELCVRENQENLERVVENLAPDFQALVKNFLADPLLSFRENPENVTIIQKYARRKAVLSLVCPAITKTIPQAYISFI